jgi:hypothetical protein
MEISVPVEKLQTIKNLGNKYIPKKGQVYFSYNKGYLGLSYICETYIYKNRMEVDLGTEQFGAGVDFDHFKAVIKNFSSGNVNVDFTSNYVNVNGKNLKFRLGILKDIPGEPRVEFDKRLDFTDNLVQKAISKLQPFVVDDGTQFSCVNISPFEGGTAVWVTDRFGLWGEVFDYPLTSTLSVPGNWASNMFEFTHIQTSHAWTKYGNKNELLLIREQVYNNDNVLDLFKKSGKVRLEETTFAILKSDLMPFLNTNSKLLKLSWGLRIYLQPPNEIKLFYETENFSGEFSLNSQVDFHRDADFIIKGINLLNTLYCVKEDKVSFLVDEQGALRVSSNDNNFFILPFSK